MKKFNPEIETICSRITSGAESIDVDDANILMAEIYRLDRVINWLAQAAANGGSGGHRRSAESWRVEAEREGAK